MKNMMGMSCRTHRGGEKCITEGMKTLGRLEIKVDLKETGCDGIHWIQLAQLRALVNMVINFKPDERLQASQEGHCSMESVT